MKQSLSHALQSIGDDVLRPFHLAFPVVDLPAARSFYTEILGCTVGREKPESCVLNLHGHQIVAHCVDSMPGLATNPVDGKQVPSMHFGVVLEWDDWHQMRDRLQAKGVEFVIGPYPATRVNLALKRRCSSKTRVVTILNSSHSRMKR